MLSSPFLSDLGNGVSFRSRVKKTDGTDAKIVSPPSEVYFLLLFHGRGKSEAKLK
jgi:hypothetical protein